MDDGARRERWTRSSPSWFPFWNPATFIIDGGNSYYHDDIRRAGELQPKGIHYVDVGVSGGVWGLGARLLHDDRRRRRCGRPPRSDLQNIGAWGGLKRPERPGATGEASPAENGYLHCGPNGAGHYVKMVHNGIEYGIMAAYAEGLNILRHGNIGKTQRTTDAETTPLRNPEYYQYDIDLPEVAEVWRRGSVIGSWLLDSHRKRASEEPGSRPTSRGACRTRAKVAGPCSLPSTKAFQPRSSQFSTLLALCLTRQRRLRRQAHVRHALRIWRTS